MTQALVELAVALDFFQLMADVFVNALKLHQELYVRTDGLIGHRLIGLPSLLLRTTGLFARRITTDVSIDQAVARGQRIGSILLGSRAELYLPDCARMLIGPGAVVRAGESIVARWPDTP